MDAQSLEIIDYRNQKLWEFINENYDVTLEYHDENYYRCFHQNRNVIYYLPTGKLDIGGFTHELLHTKLLIDGLVIHGCIRNLKYKSNNLSRIFSDRLCEHICNCIEHFKMLPHFIAMGFERKDFISDYYEYKMDASELSDIKNHYKIGSSYNANAVDFYIGKYFAMACDSNDKFDYSEIFAALEKIDSKLFNVLENFMNAWEDYDETDNSMGFYRMIFESLYKELKPWISNKTII